MIIFFDSQLFMCPFDKQENIPHHPGREFYKRSAIKVNRKIRLGNIRELWCLMNKKKKKQTREHHNANP